MTDVQVEDVSCDGVRVPLYIYHRKYGSIPSNLKFDNAEELDSFVVWLAQRSGKHISVAQPMLDATIPDGSRLQATLRSEEHTSELQSPYDLVCRLLLEKK